MVEKNIVKKTTREKMKKMKSEKKSATILEDVKINVKIKLSFIWVALLFFYLYNDVFTLLQPGIVEELTTGQIEGIEFNQMVLLGAALLMAIPIFMVFLSVALPAKVNRKVNLGLGIFHAVLLIATLFAPGELWAYYALYMIFEGVFIGLIIWHTWNWPSIEKLEVTS